MLRCLLRQRSRPAAAIASLRHARAGALRPPLSQINSSQPLPSRLYATETSSKTSSSSRSTSPSAALANKRRDECLQALEAFQKDNKAVESVALLQQMVAAAPGEPGSPPSLPLSVFQNVLETCKEAMDAPGALQVLRLMQQQGHHLDGKIYSTAIGACARGGDVAAIEGLLAEMEGGGTGTQPQLTHYRELARGYRAAKQGRKALALLNAAMNKVEEGGGKMMTLNDRFYAEVLGACGAEGLIPEASMLLEALVEEKKTQGLPLRPIISGQFIFEVATADRLAGKWKNAWSVWKEVRGYGMDLTPVAFTALVRCLSEGQQHRKIVELCHELLVSPSFSSMMRREEHRINFFNSAVQAAGAIPDHAQVLQFIKASVSSPPPPPEKMSNESNDIGDSTSISNSISSKCLFQGYNACLALRDVEALRFLIDHSLASFAAAPSRRNKYLTAALKLGQWQEMQRIFATVGQQAGQEEDTYELYRLMAVGAARLGSRPVEEVGPFLDEIESRGWIMAPSLQQQLRMPAHQQQQQQRQQQQQFHHYHQQVHVNVASELLKRLGRDGWKEALQVLKRMEQVLAATATSSIPASFRDASEGQLSTTDGAFTDATTTLTATTFKNAASTYERIMAAASHTGYTEATWSIYNTMQRWGVPISPMGYNTLLYRCSQTGEVSRARALFKSMLHRQRQEQQAHAQGQGQGQGSGGSSSVTGTLVHEAPTLVNYNTMLRVLAKQGEFAEARALLASMPVPDIVSYNTVLSAGAETGNWEGTRSFLREMERAADQKGGVAPDIISYNTTLSALKQHFFAAPADSKFNPWEKGVALLHDLRKRGLPPDAMTFNILIDLGCRTGQVDQARALLPVMHRQGQRPDFVTTNTLGYGYIQAGRYADALSLLEELMPGKDFVNSRYTCVIAFTALAGLKRDKEVEAFFWQLLEQKGCNDRSSSSRSSSKVKDPAPTDFQGVMQMLLTGMAQVGRVDDGVALMASLEGRMAAEGGGGAGGGAAAAARRPVSSSSRITEEVFQSALKMCKGQNNLEGALTLLREMEKRGLRATVGGSLEPVLCLASMLREWKKGLELVEAAWQHTPALRKERALHKHRIVYYAYLGDLLGCRRAFAEMQAEGIEPDADCYGGLLRCEVERGDDRKRLRDLLKRVREEKLGMTQELAHVHLLTFKKLQDWRGALLFFDGIVKDQERRERGHKGLRITTRMVNNVLDTLAQCGEWERLLALVEKMEARFGAKPDNVSYLQHLNALGQLARLEEAMSIFERLRAGEFGDEVGPRREMYTNLMAAFARWGRVDQAERVFAMQKDDAIPDTQHGVNSLMIAYARCGQLGEAIKTFESIPSLLGEAPDLVAYNALINAHRLGGTPLQEGGLLLYRDLLAQGLAPDASTYTPLIHSCQEEGLWPVGMYLLEESRFAMSSSLASSFTSSAAALRGKATAAAAVETDEKALQSVEGKEAAGGKEEAEEGDTEVQWGRAGSRLDIVKTTIGCLDRMGVDLFAQEVYKQGYHEGLFNHWLTVMGEQVIDFHEFSRPMAKAAIHCALEEMVAEREQQLARPRAVRKALIHPWIIIVGQGRSSAAEGKSVLRREVIDALAKVEPPLEAETDPANPGRLLVHQRQLRIYAKAVIDKKVKAREQEGWGKE